MMIIINLVMLVDILMMILYLMILDVILPIVELIMQFRNEINNEINEVNIIIIIAPDDVVALRHVNSQINIDKINE